jgi:hypothetical protein
MKVEITHSKQGLSQENFSKSFLTFAVSAHTPHTCIAYGYNKSNSIDIIINLGNDANSVCDTTSPIRVITNQICVITNLICVVANRICVITNRIRVVTNRICENNKSMYNNILNERKHDN